MPFLRLPDGTISSMDERREPRTAALDRASKEAELAEDLYARQLARLAELEERMWKYELRIKELPSLDPDEQPSNGGALTERAAVTAKLGLAPIASAHVSPEERRKFAAIVSEIKGLRRKADAWDEIKDDLAKLRARAGRADKLEQHLETLRKELPELRQKAVRYEQLRARFTELRKEAEELRKRRPLQQVEEAPANWRMHPTKKPRGERPGPAARFVRGVLPRDSFVYRGARDFYWWCRKKLRAVKRRVSRVRS
jgi:DNA repair exonuclease SbcCD ATPase subunit